MKNEELRKACELAGLEWLRHLGVWVTPGVNWTYPPNDPALPAYVASLLVAKVWATRYQIDNGTVDRYLDNFDTLDCAEYFADDEQRIRAAVAALGKGENE